MLNCPECTANMVEKTLDGGDLVFQNARVLLRGITVYECVRCRDRAWPASAIRELERRAVEEKSIPGFVPVPTPPVKNDERPPRATLTQPHGYRYH